MKELSVEEKAKLYDKAIAHARLLLKTIGNATLGNLVLKNEFKTMFPALEESEDERIKKTLIKYFRNCVSLEGINGEDISNWLEKQGEQKPADKVEPKFKVGDWILIDNPCQIESIDNNGNYVVQYCDTEETHILSRNFCDSHFRLWTIQDAKDGDVLAAHECLVLFREIDGLNIRCYCTYHFMNNPSFYVDTLQNKEAFLPATKEQRDLLFQKMKEAGYEWDAEKKEMKKVEQKHAAWSEEDEKMILAIPLVIDTYPKQEMFYGHSKEKLISWIKSIKDRVQLQDRINIEVWVTKNKQWILKLNGKVVRGQWGDEPQCIYKQFFYLSEIESLKE